MGEQLIVAKIHQIKSDVLQKELLRYLDYLIAKEDSETKISKKPRFGCAKGTFKMADDFDTPLEDIMNYMQ